MHRLRFSALTCALGLVFSLVIPATAIEIPMDLKMKLLGADAEGRGKSLSSVSNGDSPDNSIDSLTYMIGGGDGFRISIVDLPSQEYFPTVDQKGNLYEGEIGLIPLGKIPLYKAQAIIAEKVNASLRKRYRVYVSLRKVKTAGVNVTGFVANPGTYVLPGNLHLLDAIKAANGGTPPAISKVDYRSVEVRSGDSVKTYDLLRFMSRQDLSQNPYLYPGDNIHLGGQDARVFVAGEVQDPIRGALPLKEGETVGELLELVRLRKTADVSAITIHRANVKSGDAEGPQSLESAKSIVLANNDVITIGAQVRLRRPDTVDVTGEVNRPGTYAFRTGESSLKALLELAGGPTNTGDPDRAFILRHGKKDQVMNGFSLPENTVASLPGQGKYSQGSLQAVRPEVAGSLNDLRQSGDFIVIEGEAAAKTGVLEDGDEVHIPRKESFVYVSGNVRIPGAYPYVAGAGYAHYIDQAQGYTDKADRKNQYILATYNEVTQIRPLGAPRAGDIIVVPAAVEYKRFTSVYLPLLQIIPAIISIALTIVIVVNQ